MKRAARAADYSSREALVYLLLLPGSVTATAAGIPAARVSAAAKITASMAAVMAAAVPTAAAVVMPVTVMVAWTAVSVRTRMTLVAAAAICNARINAWVEIAVRR